MTTNENQAVEQPAVEEQTAPAQAQQPAAGLTLQDLILVAQVIQLTSQRGAFRAEELEQVGGLYNKLVSFLESTGALTRTQPTPDPAASEEPAEEN